MLDYVPFTYERVNESSLPEWVEGDDIDKPVAYSWWPSIPCSQSQLESQGHLPDLPSIPWSHANVCEIRVDSRKAYELFCRIAPKLWRGEHGDKGVRINPPEPDLRLSPSGVDGVAIWTGSKQVEVDLASTLFRHLHTPTLLLKIPDEPGLYPANITPPSIAVVVQESMSDLWLLYRLLQWGCKILCSDAGAAEEYLCRYAAPGSWHIEKTWNRHKWLVKIRDLMDQDLEVDQIGRVDLTPFMKIGGGK